MLQHSVLVYDVLEVCVLSLVKLVVHAVNAILAYLVSQCIADNAALLLKILSLEISDFFLL